MGVREAELSCFIFEGRFWSKDDPVCPPVAVNKDKPLLSPQLHSPHCGLDSPPPVTHQKGPPPPTPLPLPSPASPSTAQPQPGEGGGWLDAGHKGRGGRW